MATTSKAPAKRDTVAELTEAFRTSSAAVLTEYRGLSVSQLTQLRRALGASATYTVTKNTLARRAADAAGVEGLGALLAGSTAVAFIQGDPVEAAKAIKAFAKDNPLLVVKGGVLDGKPLSAAEIGQLADLESREVLLSKMAGALKASLSQAVGLFAAPLSQAVRLIVALESTKTPEPAPVVAEAPTDEAPADAAPDAPAPTDEAPADAAPDA
jgi:large subunit ribosomal protein L10